MDFLFEIGLEEVPARMLAGAEAELSRRVAGMLERERLVVAGVAIKSFSTPRRLAVWVGEVAERQADALEEMLGPAVKIAYKDGVATPAAVAFAKKAGVAVGELKTVTTAKGEYLQATSMKPGRGAAEVIAAELPKELAGIYWAKNMYWRAGRPERFVRPVRWLLALLGEALVPVEFAGYTAGRVTFGHRVLFGAEPIEIDRPGEYEAQLKAAFVVADVEARRHTIRKSLDRVCRTLPETRWREDHALVDKLTHLTEWPSVIAGGFEAEYLALPEEVLVTVMRDHQSYFAVEDQAGKLAPHFLAVLNTEADAAGEAVIRHGNARVLRARFNDARFFWEFDQRVPLVEREKLLPSVTFQKDWGTYAGQSMNTRVLAGLIAKWLTERGCSVDTDALDWAARLAKTDLSTELVKEFTDLQGIVGGLYARAEGFQERVALAIYDHYLPKSMDDSVPTTIEGALLAIADKAGTMGILFSLGLEPTGSRDPFALRRAANGIIKILVESPFPMPLALKELADAATKTTDLRALRAFFRERFEFYLREVCGHAYDVVRAVLAVEADDVRDAIARASAVTSQRASPNFLAVCEAFKRMKGILTQASDQQLRIEEFSPLFSTDFEVSFWREVNEAAAGYSIDCDAHDYESALRKLALLRPHIDEYFDSIMVMVANDEDLRAHRLGTVEWLYTTFRRIADFSEIVTQS